MTINDKPEKMPTRWLKYKKIAEALRDRFDPLSHRAAGVIEAMLLEAQLRHAAINELADRVSKPPEKPKKKQVVMQHYKTELAFARLTEIQERITELEERLATLETYLKQTDGV